MSEGEAALTRSVKREMVRLSLAEARRMRQRLEQSNVATEGVLEKTSHLGLYHIFEDMKWSYYNGQLCFIDRKWLCLSDLARR